MAAEALSEAQAPYVELEERPLHRRLLFGIVPQAVATISALLIVIALNVYWAYSGSLRLSDVPASAAVDADIGPPFLLSAFRGSAACLAWAVLAEAGISTRRKGEHPGLIFLFFTIWSWLGMALYFTQVFVVGLVCKSGPPEAYAAVLWVWFEVLYALAWLVFWAVWLVLIPLAHKLDDKGSIQLLWKDWVLVQHNANVVLMNVELLLSQWTMCPEHVIFCGYIGVAYSTFNNFVLQRKHGFQPYPFLNYDTAGVLGLIGLITSLLIFFGFGVVAANALKS